MEDRASLGFHLNMLQPLLHDICSKNDVIQSLNKWQHMSTNKIKNIKFEFKIKNNSSIAMQALMS